MKHYRTGIISLLAAAFMVSTLSLSGSEAFIVRDGNPRAAIVIADNPARMQKLAATELQKYIEKISGAKLAITTAPTPELPLKIYVGMSESVRQLGLDNSDLEHGAYIMQSGSDYLALVGRDTDSPQEKPGSGGPLYPVSHSDRRRAVKAWQEKHGEQWSTPFGSHFKGYNSILKIWAHDERGSLNAVNDYLRSLGVEWYMPGEFGEILPRTSSIPLPQVKKTVRPEFATRHMGFYSNGAFLASADEMLWQLRLGLNPKGNLLGHGIANMLLPEKTKKEHPEYYALYGGRRETESRGGKPCHSSQGLLESSIAFARLMFDEYDRQIVSLMPTDGYSYFCQCDLCKGKDTPERGNGGLMSDYVWDFMNRAATAIHTTHPDRKISCYAYSTYLLPPEKIETFSPALTMGICQHRSSFKDPEVRRRYLDIREGFLKKLPGGKLTTYDYYLHARSGVPVYFPRIIIQDMQSLKGRTQGEYMEVYRSVISGRDSRPDPALAASHLNCWLTARLYWDPDQDAEAMLARYFHDFYGSAEKEMKTFVEYCEENHPLMHSSAEAIDKAFELLDKASASAGRENIYAERVQLLYALMEPLHELRERLAVGRQHNPVALLVDRGNDKPAIDGNLDDDFWKDLPQYELKDLVTGAEMSEKTTFKIAWANESLYLAIRCEDSDMDNLRITASKDGDSLIFSGDAVEIILETPTHAHYQIAIDPECHIMDLDRKGGLNILWSSGVEAATAKSDKAWSIEARVPVLGATQEELDPEYGVAGDKPSLDRPWYFNICRLRKREKIAETSAFSPTVTGGFHNAMKFARLQPDQ